MICQFCGTETKTRPTCRSCAAIVRRGGDPRAVPTCKTCSNPITGSNRTRAVYCSVPCKFADPEVRAKIGPPKNSVTKVCPGCQEEFSVPVSNAPRFTYCSRACSSGARGEDRKCRRCGGVFRCGRGTGRRHCSEACRRPPVLLICEVCSDEFRVTPSDADAGRRYCSVTCYRRSTAETNIERQTRGMLMHLGVPFEQEARVGRWTVDFLVGDRVVVEADGGYWHSLRPDVDARKTAELTALGYTVHRFPESVIQGEGFGPALHDALRVDGIVVPEDPGVYPAWGSVPVDEDRVVDGETQSAPIDGEYHQLLLDI